MPRIGRSMFEGRCSRAVGCCSAGTADAALRQSRPHASDRSGNRSGAVTTNSADFDFHYRYFWPWAGTNEDPVTGGVQTFLTKYWTDKLNKIKLKAFQSSSRTGSMTTELLNDKVLIYGEAVIVFEGEFKN